MCQTAECEIIDYHSICHFCSSNFVGIYPSSFTAVTWKWYRKRIQIRQALDLVKYLFENTSVRNIGYGPEATNHLLCHQTTFIIFQWISFSFFLPSSADLFEKVDSAKWLKRFPIDLNNIFVFLPPLIFRATFPNDWIIYVYIRVLYPITTICHPIFNIPAPWRTLHL